MAKLTISHTIDAQVTVNLKAKYMVKGEIVFMIWLKAGEGLCPSCFQTPEWYSVTISINHLFLTVNRFIIITVKRFIIDNHNHPDYFREKIE